MQRTSLIHTVARVSGALLAVATLVLSVGCGRLLSIDAEDCTIGNVGAGGTEQKHTYKYHLDCFIEPGSLVGDVNGSYDVETQVAQEKLKGPKGTITAEWICPRDPWIRGAADSFRCTRTSRTANLNVDDRDLQMLLSSAPPAYPYSAYVLSDANRDVLEGQLGNALKPKPTPPPTPAPTPKPAKPDLVLTRLTGPAEVFDGTTAVYEVAIWNDGTPANGTAQVVLNFLGTMQAMKMVDTPAGFTCEPERGFTCTGSLGGFDSPVQERGAVFKVMGHATAKGAGTVVASLNHDRALDEVTVDNNLKTLNVTVK
ncbi:MAG: hypothetical protein AB7R89_27530 [Dehalococcoidia bacterium]